MIKYDDCDEITDGDRTIYVFTKGHINQSDYDTANIADNLGLRPEDLKVTQMYGAKLQTAFSRSEDLGYEFRVYNQPGRGRFLCTIFHSKKRDMVARDS